MLKDCVMPVKVFPQILLLSLLSLLALNALGQTQMIIKGNVFDASSHDPLPFATVGVKGHEEETITGAYGNFELRVPVSYLNDTLSVTYLGYAPFAKRISELQSVENIYLKQSYTVLKEVVVSHIRFNARQVDKGLRPIRGNLYAMETEVTNAQYNMFLTYLAEQHPAQLEACDYDLSSYNKGERDFFRRYASPYRGWEDTDTIKTIHISPHEVEDYPAINVSHEGAEAYCRWLTEQYNAQSGRKKYKNVKFRLPTLQEWQIAALGYRKFQTWKLEDNTVSVTVADDSLSMSPKKGTQKTIPVGKDVWYPWFGSYYYRQSPQNHRGCFLGNFKITFVERPCPFNPPAYDGWSMMARTASYFPNDMGLYDVVGNVAEMISEKGQACGGSWDDLPFQSTIHSIKSYTKPGATIGFRVFMEVLEE